MNLATLRLILPAVLVFIVAGSERAYLSDFWQHLARGRAIVETRTIVSHDPFTFTVPGTAFRDCNWLTQVAYYGTFTLGGLSLVQTLNALLLAGAIAGVTLQAWRASGSTRIAGGVGVGVAIGVSQCLTIRPQTISFVLFVLLHEALIRSARDRRWLVLPPFLLAFWVNAHGGFSIGLLLIGAHGLAALFQTIFACRDTLSKQTGSALEKAKSWLARVHLKFTYKSERIGFSKCPPVAGGLASEYGPDARVTGIRIPWMLGACLLASICVTLLNPYGLDVYRYAGALSTIGIDRGIEEWLRPRPTSLIGAMLVLSIAALATLAMMRWRRLELTDIALAICFLPPALMSMRMIPWWMFALAPTFARLLRSESRAIGTPCQSRPHGARVAFALMLIACIFSLPWMDRFNPLVGPIRPATRVEQHLADLTPQLQGRRVFTRLEWGNYFCWSLPSHSVFAEGHIEMYPEPIWAEYMTLSGADPGWEKVLDAHGVDAMVLDSTYHQKLIANLSHSPEWRKTSERGDVQAWQRGCSPAFGSLDSSSLDSNLVH